MRRLKPDPVPVVSPVPEYAADTRLRAVYEDTKKQLQVPWMGVVTMAFAHYPTFYDTLWGGLRALAGSNEFLQACTDLRQHTETEVSRLSPPSIREYVSRIGYGAREVDEIDGLIEIFSHGNMPYLMIATAARLLLEGEELSTASDATPAEGWHGPSHDNRLVLIEPHHADQPTRDVYEDIKSVLGLPFVNTDYRALSRWPSYFAQAWSPLRNAVLTDAYEPVVTSVHDFAVERARALPNPGRLNASTLKSAAEADATLEEVLEVVRLFQWLLPGLATNVAFFRAGLKDPSA